MKKFVLKDFLNELNDKLEIIFEKTLEAEGYWNLFEKIYSDVLNKHAPLRSRSRKERKMFNKPWITKGIMKSIKTKKKLYRMVLNDSSKVSWEDYKKYRNKLTHTIENSKRIHFSYKVKASKSNPKKLWQTLNSIINLKGKRNANHVNSLNDGDAVIDKPIDISNHLNNFFTNVGMNLSKEIGSPSKNCIITPTSHISKCSSSFFLSPFTCK